jgi:hypothetical protein
MKKRRTYINGIPKGDFEYQQRKLHAGEHQIYCLSDPTTFLPMYIGKTKDIFRRSESYTYKSKRSSKELKDWLARLRKQGLNPQVTILDWTNDYFAIWKMERKYVKKFLRRGFKLLNTVYVKCFGNKKGELIDYKKPQPKYRLK